MPGRNVLFSMFGGKVPLRLGTPKPGELPYLIARVGLNRSVLLSRGERRGLPCGARGSFGDQPRVQWAYS